MGHKVNFVPIRPLYFVFWRYMEMRRRRRGAGGAHRCQRGRRMNRMETTRAACRSAALCPRVQLRGLDACSRTTRMLTDDLDGWQRANTRELGGTAIVAMAAIAAAYFLRNAFVHVIWMVKERRGLERGLALAPFPSWEIQVVLTQLQGLAEATGDALGSGCFVYEFFGAVCMLALLLFISFCCALIFFGFRRKEAVWIHISHKECFKNMKEAVSKHGEHKTITGKAIALYQAVAILHVRGEWEEHDVALPNRIHTHIKQKHHRLDTRFVERYGPLFDSYHRTAWWYGIWVMLKALMLGIILNNVLDPIRNCTACLTLGTADAIILLIFNPDSDWHEVSKNVFRAICNVAVVGAVLSFARGTIDGAWFSSAFQALSILSMLPIILSALFAPLINLVSHLYTFIKHVPHFCAGANTTAAAIAAVGVAGVVGMDGDLIADGMEDVRRTESGKEEDDAENPGPEKEAQARASAREGDSHSNGNGHVGGGYTGSNGNGNTNGNVTPEKTRDGVFTPAGTPHRQLTSPRGPNQPEASISSWGGPQVQGSLSGRGVPQVQGSIVYPLVALTPPVQPYYLPNSQPYYSTRSWA